MTRRIYTPLSLLLAFALSLAAPATAQKTRQAVGQPADETMQAPAQPGELIGEQPYVAQPGEDWNSTQSVRPVGPGGRAVVPVPNDRPDYRPYKLVPQIWTDRQQYTVGERMRVYFRVNEDGYVYVFNTDGAGRRTQIFPNWFDKENRVRAGYTYQIPDGSYDLQIQPPAGQETLTILAVSEEYPELRGYYHTYSAQQPFCATFKAPEDVARELENRAATATADPGYAPQGGRPGKGAPDYEDDNSVQSVRPVPGGRAVVPVPPGPPYPHPVPPPVRWGMTTISLRTFDPYASAPPPVYPAPVGWLRVSTRPSSADIFVNGAFQGRTPMQLRLPAGTHNVELRRNGFANVHRRVTVGPGESSSLSIRMEPEYRYGYDINVQYDDGDFRIGGGFNQRN